ncbi:glycosyl hydrolases family 31-domain-containing protein [Phyllosticta citriasiana]|uniref:Glycosyl hydrolases family 31-domain-containing protein n=1 Tax=Phyllosticta citriasiana TaxID=595635 RepID=A0ABR1KF85_9PEZI
MVLPYQAVLAAAAQSWVRSVAAASTSTKTTTNFTAAGDVHYYGLGDFRVSINKSAPSFEVLTSGGAEVWKTPSDRPFITVSTGQANLTDSSGNFEIDATLLSASCASPVLTSTTQAAWDQISLSGHFQDTAAHCQSYLWRLSLSPSDSSPSSVIAFNASVSDSGNSTAQQPLNVNTHIALASPSDEAFYGLGSQPSLGNLRGRLIPVWSREGGVGRGTDVVSNYLNGNPSISGTFAGGSALTAYTAVGTWVSSLGRLWVLSGSAFAIVDLASQKPARTLNDTAAAALAGENQAGDFSATAGASIEIVYEGSTVEGFVGKVDKGNPLLEAVGALTGITGRQPRLPDWVHDGAILGIQGGQEKVEGIVKAAKNASLPLVAVWLQDWSGTRLQAGAFNISLSRLWWNWEADQELYPTWSDWVPHLWDTYGVRTMSYVNTFLANVSSKTSGYTRSFYDEAKAQGRFVLNATTGDDTPWTVTSGPGIDAGLLDLSNETTVQWFKDLFKEQYYSVPISGAMQDFGEYLAVDDSVSISSGKVDPRVFHNAYPGVWARLLREATEEAGRANDTVGFHRSASTWSAPYTNLFWVGDQNIDETLADGMRSSVSATLHVGLSGWGHAHSDVGGYTNTLSPVYNITRTAALLGRWGELGAFSGSAFRTHEGNIPSVNAQTYTNSSTLAYHAYNARLYRSLKDYRKTLMEEYQDKGWPLQRHPIVYSTSGTVASSVVDEVFWFGEALLIAPVYNVTSQKLAVQLPEVELNSEGAPVESDIRFKHLWTGALYKPGQVVVLDAPWGKPGVFVRWPLADGEQSLLKGLFDFATKENSTKLVA